MKVKKVIILLSVFYAVQIVSACYGPTCGDDGGAGEYKLQAITLNHIDRSGGQYTMTTSGEVSKSAYGLLTTFEIDYTLAMKSDKSPVSFFASAYACDPAPILHGIDTVTSIRVLSLQDFNAEHVAGSDVSDFFEIIGIDKIETLDEYIHRYGSGNIHDVNYVYLMLKTPPVGTGPFQFKIEALLKDGRKLEATTSAIALIE